MFALKRRNGFTTIEVLIAVGWASVILLAAFTGAYSVFRQNSQTKIIIQDNEFVSAITQEIALPSRVVTNLSFPPPANCSAPTNAPSCPSVPPIETRPGAKRIPRVGRVPIVLTNFQGFGGDYDTTTSPPTPVPVAAPFDVRGTGGLLQLTELSYERKPGIGTEIIGGWIYEKHFILAHIVTSIRDPDNNQWRQRPERTLEVPVLVNPNVVANPDDDTIAYVNGTATEDSPQVNCNTLGGVTAQDGSCKVAQNDFRGYYVMQMAVGTTTETCKSGNPLAANQCACPPSNVNPAVDSFPYQSGSGQWSYTYYYSVGCGKKGVCMYPATNFFVDTYYICIDNQKNI